MDFGGHFHALNTNPTLFFRFKASVPRYANSYQENVNFYESALKIHKCYWNVIFTCWQAENRNFTCPYNAFLFHACENHPRAPHLSLAFLRHFYRSWHFLGKRLGTNASNRKTALIQFMGPMKVYGSHRSLWVP